MSGVFLYNIIRFIHCILSKKRLWVYGLLWLWALNPTRVLLAFPDNRTVLLALADSLYHYGSYYEAVTEYKRFIVFHPRDPELGQVYSKMGLAYQKLGEWDNSLKAFLSAIEHSGDFNFKNENRISIAVTAIASGDYNLALLELHKVVLLSDNEWVRHKAFFFQTVAYVYQTNWSEAKQSLQLLTADSLMGESGAIVQEIDSLLKAGSALRFKSPAKAKWLSTFLPGAGQFYSGDYKDAFNAFALNSINFGFTFHLIRHEAYVDAALFFLYIAIRYYSGNRYHAERIANEYNANLIDDYKGRSIRYLLELSQKLASFMSE